MAPKCNLLIDSCCDLPLELIPDDITVMNFCYIIDDEIYPDDFFQSVGVTEFYDMLRNGAMPTTSQVTPSVLEREFRKGCESGIPTVYLSMSSGISSNYESASNIANIVKADYPDAELYVIDTRMTCTPEGLLCLEAFRLRNQGLTGKQLAAWAEEARFHAAIQFMVDDLDTLHRGGRVPKTVAVVGEKLNLKPMLKFSEDGTLGVCGAVRGRKKGIKALAKAYKENHDPHSKMVLIGNADCPEDAEKLKKEIQEIDPGVNVIIHNVGTTIGAHVGPGMISVGYWGNDKREAVSVSDRIAKQVQAEH